MTRAEYVRALASMGLGALGALLALGAIAALQGAT